MGYNFKKLSGIESLPTIDDNWNIEFGGLSQEYYISFSDLSFKRKSAKLSWKY